MPMAEFRRGRPRVAPVQEGVRAVERCLDVLELLASKDGMTLSEISAGLRQSVATTQRILVTLERRGAIERDAGGQGWCVGPTAFRLGSAFLRRADVVERSRPTMRELTALTGETSNLGIEHEGSVLFVSQIQTHEFIRAFFRPGSRSPLHASGIGKALLSIYEPSRVRAFLRGYVFERFTENTIDSAARLLGELEHVRRQGFALDAEERAPGMRCLAAPIIDSQGEAVAGISISGPSSRIPDHQIAAIGEQVKEAAKSVSRLLGA